MGGKRQRENLEETAHTVSHDLVYGLGILSCMFVVLDVVLGELERKRSLDVLVTVCSRFVYGLLVLTILAVFQQMSTATTENHRQDIHCMPTQMT